MATIQKRKNKKGTVRYEIQYYKDGARKTISLDSGYDERQAKRVKAQLEELLACLEARAKPDASLAAWLENLGDDLRERLAKADLLTFVEPPTHGEIWRRFYDSPRFQRMAPNTARNYRGVAVRFFRFFDESRRVEETSKADADEWRKSLVDASAPHGWNYYRVRLDEPVEKGGVLLKAYASPTRYVAAWVGDDEPTRIYYYRGGATGSFIEPSDWVLTPDGLVPCVEKPTQGGATFYVDGSFEVVEN